MHCSRCGHTSMDAAGTCSCSLCGFPLMGANTGGFSGTVPWESPDSSGKPVLAIAMTLSRSFSIPGRFFAAVALNRSLLPAVIYALVMGSIGTLGSLLWRLALPLPASSLFENYSDPFSPAGLIAAPAIIVMQISFISLFIHAMLVVTGSARKRFSVTTKTVCYAYGAAVFQLVPFLGQFLSLAAGIYLVIRGIHAAHGISTLRAITVLVLPLLLFMVLAMVILALFLAFGLLSAGQLDLLSLFGK